MQMLGCKDKAILSGVNERTSRSLNCSKILTVHEGEAKNEIVIVSLIGFVLTSQMSLRPWSHDTQCAWRGKSHGASDRSYLSAGCCSL